MISFDAKFVSMLQPLAVFTLLVWTAPLFTPGPCCPDCPWPACCITPQISLRMEEIGKNCGWFGSWTGPETAPPGSVDGTTPCPGALAQGGP